MYDMTPIKDYIIFLKQKMNLAVTVHIMKYKNIEIPLFLPPFNIHDNSYCLNLKSHPNIQQHCTEKQKSVYEKSCGGSFCGICHAGVREYVYPIFYNNSSVGFICVSGYKCDNHTEYTEKISHKYKIPKALLNASYNSLKSELPPKEAVDTLIAPLCHMLELAYIKSDNDTSAEFSMGEKIENHLKLNHSDSITSKDICKQFHCSRSYMSREFNRHTGMSIREYLTKLRIDDAKSMLVNSNLNITEIALAVGFGDSNYFSSLFKKITGASPSEYRRSQKIFQAKS